MTMRLRSPFIGSQRDLVLLEQVLDALGGLGALRDPVLQALGVDTQRLFVLDGQRVVEPEALDVTAIARVAAIGRDQVIEGTLLRAAAAKTDSHHEIRSSIKNEGRPLRGSARR